MSPETLTARFLDTAGGRIFVVLRRPAGAPRGCVLVAAPFGEEMNKSRRMIALLAAQLAQRGVATVIVDPFGTGDSEGDFEDADWQRWKRDLRDTAQWCESQGLRVTSLLGIRLGCALAAEFANEALAVSTTAFWQPVLDGSRFLDQFLRLRVAASMMEPDNRESTADLRRRLLAGESLEIAGYTMSARLAAQLDQVRLPAQLTARLGRLHWHEIVRAPDVPPPAVSTKTVENARTAGLDVSMHAIGGEPFWSSVEIVTNAALVEQSAAALAGQP